MDNEIEQFKKITDEIIKLKEGKAEDYQNCWKVFGIEGINAMLGKKFSRIWVNRFNPKTLNFESLRDSYRDLAIYSIMAIQLIDEGLTSDQFEELLKR